MSGKIAIIDYGVGNIFSLVSSFRSIGADAQLTKEFDEIRAADKIVLPGVGAFSDAAAKLRESGMWQLVLEECGGGKPLLGICLGMQMLFEKSYEYGEHQGLGLIPGRVVPIAPVVPADYKIPHIGWNALRFTEKKSPLFKYVKEGEHVYFVHSYYATDCEESTIANTEYSAILTAAVQRDNVMGTQFHPEKSGEVGQRILKGFMEWE